MTRGLVLALSVGSISVGLALFVLGVVDRGFWMTYRADVIVVCLPLAWAPVHVALVALSRRRI